MPGCVADTATVDLSVSGGGVLEASVKISGDAGNALVAHGDGLYVAAAETGTVVFFAGAVAPTGWLLCDGGSYLRATYAALFALIGTTYGSADGTHFNVPDLRGRVAVGLGTNTDCDALADSEGEAVGNRSPKHKTSNTLGINNTLGTTHNLTAAGNDDGSVSGQNRFTGTDHGETFEQPIAGGVTLTGAVALTGDTGSGGSRPTDTPAFLTLNAIVKT